jgi:hypothetical protein
MPGQPGERGMSPLAEANDREAADLSINECVSIVFATDSKIDRVSEDLRRDAYDRLVAEFSQEEVDKAFKLKLVGSDAIGYFTILKLNRRTENLD